MTEDEKKELIEKIRSSNNAGEISDMIFLKIIDKEIFDAIYSRKGDFSTDEFYNILDDIIFFNKLEDILSKELFNECVDFLNNFRISTIKNTESVDDIIDNLNLKYQSSSVIEAAFSRKDDFSGEEKENLFDEIVGSPQTNNEILKEIVKESNNFLVIRHTLENKNVDEGVVRVLWNRRDYFGGEDVNLKYNLILMCPASPKDLLIEALNNYFTRSNSFIDFMEPLVILNQNLDQEIYEILLLKLKKLYGGNYFQLSVEEIDKDYSEPEDQFLDSPIECSPNFICYMLIKYVENAGKISQNVVEGYVKYILKEEKYLKAYRKLMSFRCQKLSSLELGEILFKTKDPEVFNHVLNSKNADSFVVYFAYFWASIQPYFAEVKEDMLQLRPYLAFLNVESIEVGTYNKEYFKEREAKEVAKVYIMLYLDDISPKALENFIVTCLGPEYLAWYKDLMKDKKPVGPKLSS